MARFDRFTIKKLLKRYDTYQLKSPFSKWLISAKWAHLVPEEYTPNAKNIRIVNSTTTIRDWYRTLSADPLGLLTKVVRCIVSTTNLYVVLNLKLYQVDTTTGVLTQKAVGTTFANDVKTRAVVYGQYIIFNDWTSYPYVYDEKSDTLTQLNTSIVGTLKVNAGSTGYQVGDIVSITQASASKGQAIVTEIDAAGTGIVQNVWIYTHWTGYSVATGLATTIVNRSWPSGLTIDIVGLATPITTQQIATAGINAGNAGTGYTVGDIITVTQKWGNNGTIKILTAPAGVPATVSVVNPWAGYTLATGLATTGWTGTGLKIDILTLVNPMTRFGDVFSYATFLVGWWENKNAMWISPGITHIKPEYAIDFSSNGSDIVWMKWPIAAVKSTLDRLFIRTDRSIEYIDKTALGAQSRYATPLAGTNTPGSPDLVVSADDKVFFWTDDNRMKALNYIAGITEAQVIDLTNRPNQWIDDILATLDSDQSWGFGYYDKEKKLVYFYLKTKNEQFNNICIIYDPVYDSFFYDTNKFFWTSAKLNGNYYCGSDMNAFIFQDAIGKDDDWLAIARERDTALLSIGNPNLRKAFREVNIFGEIDELTTINMSVLVDWVTVYTGTITKNGEWVAGIGNNPIAEDMVGANFSWWVTGRIPFEKRLTYTNLSSKGKTIQVKFWWDNSWGDWCLSGMSIKYQALGDSLTSDKR